MVKLSKQERFKYVKLELSRTGRLSIAELSKECSVSEMTIRRDLKELADEGILHLINRGAIPSINNYSYPAISRRMEIAASVKGSLGRAASNLVEEGDSVFIGSGSTMNYVARHLSKRNNLTIITNALNVGIEFANSTNNSVIVLGGWLRNSELSLIGHMTEQFLNEIRVDKVIASIQSISVDSGLYSDYLPEVMTDRKIFASAPKIILVADHTKFSKQASAFVTSLNSVTTIVTDSKTDSRTLSRISQQGIELIIVED